MLFYFIFGGLLWVFVAAHGLFSGSGEWGLLFVALRGLLIAVASLAAQSTGSRHAGSVVVARQL